MTTENATTPETTTPEVPTETQIVEAQAKNEKVAIAEGHANNIETLQQLAKQGLIPKSMEDDPDLIKLDEDIKKEAEKGKPEETKAPEEKKPEEKTEEKTEEGEKSTESKTKTEEKTKPEDKTEEEKKEEADKKKEEETKPEGMFFQKKQKKPQSVNTLEEAGNHIRDKFDINVVDDPKNFTTFFNSVDNWRKDAQQMSEIKEKFDNQTNGLMDLPQPIKDAMKVWSEAGDYKEAFVSASEQPDFSKDWKSHDQEDLINFYFPKEASELMEAWNEKDDDGNRKMTDKEFEKKVDSLHSITQPMYKNDKNNIETQRTAYAQRATDNEKLYAESVQSSVESLIKDYPGIGDEGRANIKRILTDGDPVSNVLRLVFENGVARKEAATGLAFLLYGGEQQKHMVAEARRKGESAAGEKLVAGADKKINPGKGGAQTITQEQAQKEVEKAMGLGLQNDPYTVDATQEG